MEARQQQGLTDSRGDQNEKKYRKKTFKKNITKLLI
jgi:hypothetical protein